MVAVVDGASGALKQRVDAPVLHRLVAVAVTPAQLGTGALPAVRVAGVSRVDLLVLTDGAACGPDADDADDDGADDDGADDDGADDPSGPGSRLQALAEASGVPGPAVHRLALPSPIGPRDVDDVVAAISELVGFDPEPGVACLVPAARPTVDDPADAVLGRAVERIVAAYGLPVLTYQPG